MPEWLKDTIALLIPPMITHNIKQFRDLQWWNALYESVVFEAIFIREFLFLQQQNQQKREHDATKPLEIPPESLYFLDQIKLEILKQVILERLNRLLAFLNEREDFLHKKIHQLNEKINQDQQDLIKLIKGAFHLDKQENIPLDFKLPSYSPHMKDIEESKEGLPSLNLNSLFEECMSQLLAKIAAGSQFDIRKEMDALIDKRCEAVIRDYYKKYITDENDLNEAVKRTMELAKTKIDIIKEKCWKKADLSSTLEDNCKQKVTSINENKQSVHIYQRELNQVQSYKAAIIAHISNPENYTIHDTLKELDSIQRAFPETGTSRRSTDPLPQPRRSSVDTFKRTEPHKVSDNTDKNDEPEVRSSPRP